ncbi:Linear gramicidin synthase subunit D [Streptomyces sp. YIM 130001]|uniref:condensation domain-containing protein n=1 Tax=Streptomyces sp. YIM 130001 TaxID=2259644 RepID=UPI000E65743A|nr:condensation domain-containing protein [Streptomyces sp. YIM 130001]RII13399.1 Linear gramicidin synthase subunit D [Streptomyces sp. YIM 130001]
MDTDLRERLATLSPERRAELLARLRAEGPARRRGGMPGPVPPLPPDTVAPMSYAQQRMWFLDQLMEHQAIYHTPVVLRLRGPLDVSALGRALTALVARHAVLRTRFARDQQIVEDPPASVPLPLEDLSGLDASGRERAVYEHVAQAARQPFDLTAAAPLRARLYRFAPDDHVFALILHHAVVDDWSIPLLVGELSRDYATDPGESGARPPAPDVQYTDYAAWQRDRIAGPVGERQADYWARQLAGAVPTVLPADRPRPHRPTWAGETITGVTLPPHLAEKLTAVHDGPLLTVLATALNALLTRWTESTDITIGTVFAGRIRPELESLIGFFTNTVALRTSSAGDPSLDVLLERTADTVTDAYRHQELPFDQVVARRRPARSGARNPLFQVALVTSEAPVEEFTLGDLRVESCDVPLGTSRFDLTLSAARTSENALVLNAEYSTELFDRARIDSLLADLRTVLEHMVTAPGTAVSALALQGPVPGVTLAGTPDDAEPLPTAEPRPASELRTALGQSVSELWRERLGVDHVRADDDFFALGGGSLQAAALVVEIREWTGTDLSLGEFLSRPTLGALVAAAEDALAAKRSDRPDAATVAQADLVVPLLPGDPGVTPVFFFHASSGSSLAYAALCRELPAGIPYYGISVPGLDEGDLPGSVAEMADAYADAVCEVAPEGPYRLVGWSVGGGLAHATAVRLRARGRHVTLLAMLDTQQPTMLDEAPDAALLRAMFAENLALTAGLEPPEEWSAAELSGLDEKAQADRIIGALVDEGLVPPGSAALMRRRMEVFRVIISTAAVWRPERYDGQIDLVHAGTTPASTVEDWMPWTSGPVIGHHTPGDHYGMMRPPQVAQLGRTLGPLLAREVR